MTHMALRTALIWHDEVMEDLVLDKPRSITIGQSGKSTFVVPEIGLPPKFVMVRPGNRGYLLTLGENDPAPGEPGPPPALPCRPCWRR